MFRFLFSLYCFLLVSVAYSQAIIEIGKDTTEVVPIGTSSLYWLDSSATLTLPQIQQLKSSHRLSVVQSSIPNFGNTTAAVWMAFTFQNKIETACLLEIKNAQLYNVELYAPDQTGEYQRINNSSAKGFRVNEWIYELPYVSRPITCYLRVQSKRVLLIPAYLTTYKSLVNRNHRVDFFYGIYFGLMFVMGMYNLFLYLVFRERAYIWYVIHIFLQIVVNALIKGYAAEFFSYTPQSIDVYLPTIAMLAYLSMIVFSSSFLDTRKKLPLLHKGLFILTIIILIGIVLNLLPFFLWDSYIGIAAGMITTVYLLVVAIAAWMRKLKGATFYCLGWGIFLISLTILDLSLLGWIPSDFYTSNVTLVGGAIESMLISLALSDKINQLRKETETAQVDKLEYITRQNNWLEEKVTERTRKLASAYSIMEGQNTELMQQQEELGAVNATLRQQKTLIEQQAAHLSALNRNLETTIQERTFELKETIDNLLQQNQDLHQFSYILSHNLRSPIARIRGLVSVFNRENMNDPVNPQLLKHLGESADGLDTIIKDLSQIISVRKNLNTIKENVDLHEVFDSVVNGLMTEIESAQAKILVDFSAKRTVFSVKSYQHNILYNLISNAIKYRSPNRLPVIVVSTADSGKYTCLSVQDNGLGIDTTVTPIHQIFGFYKRLHFHVDGKGLGLYLVKTQIDSLQGKVEVESELDKGTTFRVYF